LNPIGAISKLDLRRFLRWAAAHKGIPTLQRVVEGECFDKKKKLKKKVQNKIKIIIQNNLF